MKIAVVYNRESQSVINLFGTPNREKYGKRNIKRISDALKAGGHHVIALEGDKDLIRNLEEFMPRVLNGERPGMVFNISYGVQGQARYTHVPGILEMVGIPYVGSGPLAHSLALDKVVAKMIFIQHGLPTPDFAVLDSLDFETPNIAFPMIVKPKDEAVSFGLKIVNTEEELRIAAGVILREFEKPVLVEQYIDGREVNVGVLGNQNPEVFEPVELVFGEGAPPIYTMEDKKGTSGREVVPRCPADLKPEVAEKARKIAADAFKALGLFDCCRVDLRLDKDDNIYLLEINSLPSLGERGSYVVGAKHGGYDFPALVNRLVEVATARYFGTPNVSIPTSPDRADDPLFSFFTKRRDRVEKQLQEWTSLISRTDDTVALRIAAQNLDKQLKECNLRTVREFTDEKTVWTWETEPGFEGGTLVVGHLDTPMSLQVPVQQYRKEPENLHGEGIGSSRGPIVMLLNALKGLKSRRTLEKRNIGVLFYADEGLDCRYSSDAIAKAAAKAREVIVLRPGNVGSTFMSQRRGQRRYRLIATDTPIRMGQATKRPEVLLWVAKKIEELSALTSRKDRIALSAIEIRPEHYPMLLPHRVTVTLLLSYPDVEVANEIEQQMRSILGKGQPKHELEIVSDRPPMVPNKGSQKMAKRLGDIAGGYEIPLKEDSSVWPSVAGLVPATVPVICGVGPVAKDLYTPHESISRISLMQRMLLLAAFLNGEK